MASRCRAQTRPFIHPISSNSTQFRRILLWVDMRMESIGIGGGPRAAPLPHHLACWSTPGGSRSCFCANKTTAFQPGAVPRPSITFQAGREAPHPQATAVSKSPLPLLWLFCEAIRIRGYTRTRGNLRQDWAQRPQKWRLPKDKCRYAFCLLFRLSTGQQSCPWAYHLLSFWQ